MPPAREHLLARSRFAERLDRALHGSWNRFNPKPPLDPAFLWRKGRADYGEDDEHAGRSASDVADFRQRLDLLCRSLQAEANLNALGHTLAYGQLKASIRARHALGRLWRRRPALLEIELAAPIIVVGQMRSGTTRVHRLLAADPALSATRLCNALAPVPGWPDTRPLRCAATLMLARRINPWLDMLHPFGATRADEELGWLSAALSPIGFEAQWTIPGYVAASEARDAAPVYREFARILRTDAATTGTAARPRVLKCPQYAEDLAALLAQFPTARVIVTRRDPDAVLASTVSMVASQMAVQSDHASLERIEAEWQRKLALREARMAAALADFAGPVAHVDYADLSRDWRGSIEQVYSALGLPLTPAALAAMGREQHRARRSPHHGHAGTYGGLARA